MSNLGPANESYILGIVDHFVKWMSYEQSHDKTNYCSFRLSDTIFISGEPVFEPGTSKTLYYKLVLNLAIFSNENDVTRLLSAKTAHPDDEGFLEACGDWGIKIIIPSGFSSYSLYYESTFGSVVTTAKEMNAIIDQLESTVKAKYPDTKFNFHRVNNSSSGGCYVATAVYGSYDCPQVWTLRRYRDQFLSESLLGRAFIRLYYAVSPTAVRLFGNTGWFNRFFRKHLDCFVASLLERGFSDAYYQDKNNRGV